MFIMLFLIFVTAFANVCSVQVTDTEDFLTKVTTPYHQGMLTYDIETVIKNYDYPFEEHQVETEDGYLLTLHRIPNGKVVKADDKKRPAVLMMHGLLCTSAIYVFLGPDRSLAFQLADLGYDVWMGNNRGNTYSRKHKKLSPNTNPTFWDYSFHEMGVNDIPAITDYILKNTSQEKLSYIGHSEGTTQFFVTMSMKPEYNVKYSVMIALAPVAYMKNMENPFFQYMASNLEEFELIFKNNHIYEVLPHSALLTLVSKLLCRNGSKFQEICVDLIFAIVGSDTKQLNRSDLLPLFECLPAGASVQQLIHYGQEIRSGHFRQLDYGPSENQNKYNTYTPPDYNLSKIEVPIALFYGQNDKLAAVEDVKKLAGQLSNVEKYLIKYEQFSHIDFLIAKDLTTLLYFDLINVLNKYNGLPLVTSTSTSSTHWKESTTTTTTTKATTQAPGTTTEADSGVTYLVPHYKYFIIVPTLILLKYNL